MDHVRAAEINLASCSEQTEWAEGSVPVQSAMFVCMRITPPEVQIRI